MIGLHRCPSWQHIIPYLNTVVAAFAPQEEAAGFTSTSTCRYSVSISKGSFVLCYSVRWCILTKVTATCECPVLTEGKDKDSLRRAFKTSSHLCTFLSQVTKKPSLGGQVWADGSIFAVGDCNYGCIGEPGNWEMPPVPKISYPGGMGGNGRMARWSIDSQTSNTLSWSNGHFPQFGVIIWQASTFCYVLLYLSATWGYM